MEAILIDSRGGSTPSGAHSSDIPFVIFSLPEWRPGSGSPTGSLPPATGTPFQTVDAPLISSFHRSFHPFTRESVIPYRLVGRHRRTYVQGITPFSRGYDVFPHRDPTPDHLLDREIIFPRAGEIALWRRFEHPCSLLTFFLCTFLSSQHRVPWSLCTRTYCALSFGSLWRSSEETVDDCRV